MVGVHVSFDIPMSFWKESPCVKNATRVSASGAGVFGYGRMLPALQVSYFQTLPPFSSLCALWLLLLLDTQFTFSSHGNKNGGVIVYCYLPKHFRNVWFIILSAESSLAHMGAVASARRRAIFTRTLETNRLWQLVSAWSPRKAFQVGAYALTCLKDYVWVEDIICKDSL